MLQTIYDVGFPCKLPDASRPDLATAVALEDRIRLDSDETGAFVAADGSIVVSKTGTPNHVRFVGTELAGTDGTLFTHNHPSGLPFSIQDVEAAADSDLKEVRVVGGTIRYRMWPRGGWPTVPAIYAAVRLAHVGVAGTVRHLLATGAIHPRFKQMEAEHQLWLRVALKLNLAYVRERAWP